MKLQDAFVAEVGDFLGSFEKIGYEMDETTNFKYEDNIDGANTVAIATGVQWQATSKVALNDCAKGAIWQLAAAASSTGNGAKWTASYVSPATEAACGLLTPRFLDMTRGNSN